MFLKKEQLRIRLFIEIRATYDTLALEEQYDRLWFLDFAAVLVIFPLPSQVLEFEHRIAIEEYFRLVYTWEELESKN